MLEGILKQKELCLNIDSGALCRGREPGEPDFDGTGLGAPGPWSWVPVRGAANRPFIAETDLGEGKQLAGLRSLSLSV